VTAKIFQRYFLGGCRLFQLVCAGFRSIANEPTALKQCITVRAAQNVNHVEIVDVERKGLAALWADRGHLELGRSVILGARRLLW
jgi:hypothetical protein